MMKWYEEWFLVLNWIVVLAVIGYMLVTHHHDIKQLKFQVSQIVK